MSQTTARPTYFPNLKYAAAYMLSSAASFRGVVDAIQGLQDIRSSLDTQKVHNLYLIRALHVQERTSSPVPWLSPGMILIHRLPEKVSTPNPAGCQSGLSMQGNLRRQASAYYSLGILHVESAVQIKHTV